MENQAARALTPLFFQKALVEEIKKITSDMLFQNPGGEELIKLSVFAQSLPIPEKKQDVDAREDYQSIEYSVSDTEDAVFNCPWCIVKLGGGSIPEINGYQHIEVVIGFGIYNPEKDNRGHEELLNLIQRVYQRFACDPLLDRQYTCRGEFEWALQDEDTYPYYFGAITTTFKFMGYRREMIY